MIGAGIFALLGEAGAVGGAAVWISFLVGGMSRACSARCAKLRMRFPSPGGLISYSIESFGKGRLVGMTCWLGYIAATSAVVLMSPTWWISGDHLGGQRRLAGGLPVRLWRVGAPRRHEQQPDHRGPCHRGDRGRVRILPVDRLHGAPGTFIASLRLGSSQSSSTRSSGATGARSVRLRASRRHRRPARERLRACPRRDQLCSGRLRDRTAAEDALPAVRELGAEPDVSIRDAAVVIRTDAGRIELEQTREIAPGDAVVGAGRRASWLGAPWTVGGALLGMAGGALFGSRDTGVPDASCETRRGPRPRPRSCVFSSTRGRERGACARRSAATGPCSTSRSRRSDP